MRSHLQKELVGSKLSTLGAQDQLMEMERSQIAAEHQASQDRNQIAALSYQRDAYVENWKAQVYQDLSQAEHQLAEAVAEYDKAHLRKSLVVLTASRDAVVLTIAKLSSGSVISAASELMTLVPVDSGLEVEATLTGANAGFVKLGDPAILKFETFPFPQYGGAEGTVREISPDSFSGPDTPVSNAGASATQAPDPTGNYQSFYRVRLKVDRYTLHGVPSYFHPRPGMPVTADIKVGKRTIMQFILNRMLPMLTSGMRQPG
jgi:HlyD family secretion protein